MQHLERGRDGRNQWWRYLVVVLITIFWTELLGGIPQLFVDGSGNSNIELALAMFPFVVGAIVLILLVYWLHNRRPTEIINGTRKIRWRRYFYAAAVWMGLQLLALGINLLIAPQDFVFRFNAPQFAGLLLVSILVLPVQTGFEELLFRGYLAQGIGAGTRNRIAAVLIPGLLFGLLHLPNPEVKEYGTGIMLANYLASGLALGLIAALDDGIECAMGVHFANNLSGALLVTFKSSVFTTDALFELQRIDPFVELVAYLLMSSALIFILGRRFGWTARSLLLPVGEYPLPAPAAEISVRSEDAAT